MIKTYLGLMDEFSSSYASPKMRLSRLLKAGRLIRLRRGLYTDDAATPRLTLAPLIYGPSYVSFQTALAAAGLIPERVEAVMCAAFHKNKNRVFRTPLGEYRYLYLPDAVYPYGVNLVETAAGNGQAVSWLMATPEKALCDAL
ncbi:MAG: type IV toxin-antitoxin system AbiEi family antitoxin domain-containing protein, partial [Spirochaetaceae bacterium]|nr:type IV toxin-antitoxin system AbiEi family antitoxin domain-containing protein [Spirochaetaceae bacterium]